MCPSAQQRVRPPSRAGPPAAGGHLPGMPQASFSTCLHHVVSVQRFSLCGPETHSGRSLTWEPVRLAVSTLTRD